MAKKDKKKDNKKDKKVKKGKGNLQLHLLLIFLIILSAMFLSTAVIIYIGLIPAFVAFFVDQSRSKGKAVTVGAFNLMGCMPFVLELWKTEMTMDNALGIILDPLTLVIIYMAAAFGYVVDWVVVSAASGMLYKQGQARKVAIQKRQKELVERWGESVKGEGGKTRIPEDNEVSE